VTALRRAFAAIAAWLRRPAPLDAVAERQVEAVVAEARALLAELEEARDEIRRLHRDEQVGPRRSSATRLAQIGEGVQANGGFATAEYLAAIEAAREETTPRQTALREP
jgi:hypothetical protein